MQDQLMKVLIMNNSIFICTDVVFIYYVVKRKSISQELFQIKEKKVGKVVTIGVGIGLIIAFLQSLFQVSWMLHI